MLVALCDDSRARSHVDHPAPVDAVYRRPHSPYQLHLHHTRATLVSCADPHTRTTFGYDIHVSHASSLFRNVVRPLLRAVLTPHGSAQTAVVVHGTQSARHALLVGNTDTYSSVSSSSSFSRCCSSSVSSSSSSSSLRRKTTSLRAHNGLLARTMHHLLCRTSSGLLTALRVSAVQLSQPAVLRDGLCSPAASSSPTSTTSTNSSCLSRYKEEAVYHSMTSRRDKAVITCDDSPHVVWDRLHACTRIEGALSVCVPVRVREGRRNAMRRVQRCLRALRTSGAQHGGGIWVYSVMGVCAANEKETEHKRGSTSARAALREQRASRCDDLRSPCRSHGPCTQMTTSTMTRKTKKKSPVACNHVHATHTAHTHSVTKNRCNSKDKEAQRDSKTDPVQPLHTPTRVLVQFISFPLEESDTKDTEWATLLTRRGVAVSVKTPSPPLMTLSTPLHSLCPCRTRSRLGRSA